MSYYVVVTGSRHWKNKKQIEDKLLELKAKYGAGLQIAHGQSPGGGVDLFVEQICEDHGISQTPFPRLPRDGPPPWGFLKRNERLVLSWLPNLTLGFRAEGKSNGTDHTLAFAEKLGYDTEVIYESEQDQ